MHICINILFLRTMYATILHQLLHRQNNQGLSFLEPLWGKTLDLINVKHVR